ncbi:deazaflavin-dependent oxidoreductase (nitroreductase family) [Amycolatopsis bartoniae]|uniref:Nitroreductase n=1 Tax=Amycolatopsis bartoniae TaxID=941986 RepID=A0A8H9J1T2_9PSEU|nr:nitroreductase family deazaflavin-dependent oxidoreductase [Amycolatopsis bartoniae]MBB2935405.1 deazaflavin-dependent oxidoreductase (nitroreductase family) [Amycolatopsis bartoniae]TVT03725.1 nitroreductase family deazaflavin-dependent oxidoreductase [Amycolatopsis bartoniae]GHF75847.1 nitroreductase [Amycolatopsis bartoniae]
MVLPKQLARINRVVTNRVLGPLARQAPGFGKIVHRGRRSGREYRTPVNVFATPTGYVVALTYGPDADWVRNVLAEGGCQLETRGTLVQLTNPRIVHDEQRRAAPVPVRQVLTLVGVTDFLHLDRVSPASPSAG